MIGKLKSFTLKVIAGINIVAVIAMMISGYSSHFHPQDYSTISILGLLFPFFVIVNLFFFALLGHLQAERNPDSRDWTSVVSAAHPRLSAPQFPASPSRREPQSHLVQCIPVCSMGCQERRAQPYSRIPPQQRCRHHLPARGRDQRDGQQQATSGNEHIPLSRLHENGKCL